MQHYLNLLTHILRYLINTSKCLNCFNVIMCTCMSSATILHVTSSFLTTLAYMRAHNVCTCVCGLWYVGVIRAIQHSITGAPSGEIGKQISTLIQLTVTYYAVWVLLNGLNYIAQQLTHPPPPSRSCLSLSVMNRLHPPLPLQPKPSPFTSMFLPPYF